MDFFPLFLFNTADGHSALPADPLGGGQEDAVVRYCCADRTQYSPW